MNLCAGFNNLISILIVKGFFERVAFLGFGIFFEFGKNEFFFFFFQEFLGLKIIFNCRIYHLTSIVGLFNVFPVLFCE